VKFFLKKPSEDSLQSLNEEEIQKKLYGTFHKNTKSQNASVTFNTPKQAAFTRPQPSEQLPPSDLDASIKLLVDKILNGFQSFPWKFSILVVGCLIFGIYSLQFLSGAIHQFSKLKPPKQYMISTTGQSVGKASRKVETPKAIPTKKTDQPAVTAPVRADRTPIDSPKKAYYAVQICTYQKEADAKALSTELKNSNFSAFYLRMQGKIPYYVVFLGKNESYSGANEKLKEFRSSEQYQKFPDAFIRSI